MQQKWTKEWPTDIAFETERHYWYLVEQINPEYYWSVIFKEEQARDLEKEWKALQQRFTYSQLLEIFPEAAPTIKREFKKQIANFKLQEKELFTEIRDKKNSILRARPGDRFWIESSIEHLQKRLTQCQTSIKNRQWFIRKLEGAKDNADHITHEDVAIAKQVPLTNFIQGRKMAGKLVARCPFHDEKTGSFIIYDNNTFHCFGACSKGGDVIDFIMEKNDMKFLTAVRFLTNK